MAEKAEKTPVQPVKAKRRLRTAPTLREQADISANGPKATKRNKVSSVLKAPFKLLGKVLAKIVKIIAASPIGTGSAKLWKSKLFIPVRFIARMLAKVLFISYFAKSWQELKLVSWPDNRTTMRLTFAVIMFAFVFGFIVAGMDYVFEKLFREVILR